MQLILIIINIDMPFKEGKNNYFARQIYWHSSPPTQYLTLSTSHEKIIYVKIISHKFVFELHVILHVTSIATSCQVTSRNKHPLE